MISPFCDFSRLMVLIQNKKLNNHGNQTEMFQHAKIIVNIVSDPSFLENGEYFCFVDSLNVSFY